MVTLVFGILALALGLWLVKSYSRASTQQLLSMGKKSGGILALAGAAFLGVRGQFAVAIPLGMAGLGLLGWIPGLPGFAQRTQRANGQVSRVRSTHVEMELDHDSGDMRGHILTGQHAGVTLEALDVATLTGLLSGFDPESAALLAAYLDRRQPGWGEHAHGDAAAGQARASRASKMTPQEAYEVLGLQPGASASEIAAAHRSLMKKLHPDKGGSTYLAARVNEAKDVLRGHRP